MTNRALTIITLLLSVIFFGNAWSCYNYYNWNSCSNTDCYQDTSSNYQGCYGNTGGYSGYYWVQVDWINYYDSCCGYGYLQIKEPCDWKCTQCNSPGNQNDCGSCRSGYYLWLDWPTTGANQGRYCRSWCSAGQTAALTGQTLGGSNQCQWCNNTCYSCNSWYPQQCTQCTTGNYQWLDWSGYPNNHFTCWSSCPSAPDQNYRGQTINVGTVSCQWCDTYCYACNSNAPTQCTTCMYGSWQWLDVPQTGFYQPYNCRTYCPDAVTYWGSNAYRGQTVNTAVSTNTVCQLCNTYCSQCATNDPATCYRCRSTAYLIDNYNTCIAQYDEPLLCQPDKTCVNTNCPPDFYFQVAQSDSGSYAAYARDPSHIYRNFTNFCMLCDKRCQWCSNNLNTTCTYCALKAYKWRQVSTTCDFWCTEGTYTVSTSGSMKVGEFIQPTWSTANRQCQKCNTGCMFCHTSADNCFLCQDDYFLIDDKDTCTATFTGNASCPLCGTISSANGCYTKDHTCMSTCPPYFYFKVYRGGSGDTGAQTSKYYFFTQNVSATVNADNNNYTSNGIPWNYPYYRYWTNYCKLCDFRCMKCTGPSNYNCTSCTNYYWKWLRVDVCQSFCPPSQYKAISQNTYPANQTLCRDCLNYCYVCNGTADNCTSCQGDNYNYLSVNASFLYNYDSNNSTCLVNCPNSTNNLTIKGYYGSIKTMTCYVCPGYCSNCNIQTVRTYYQTNSSLNCGTDSYCSSWIICYACLSGYTLVGGTCIPDATCRRYSYYLSTNVTSVFNPNYCTCLTGYYNSTYINCDVACDITCATCTAAGTGGCATCPTGYTYDSGTGQCAGTQLKKDGRWYSAGTSTGSFYIYQTTGTAYKTCGTYYTVFGYQHYSLGKYFRYYTGTINYPDYYAISFRTSILFIDDWPSNGAIYYRLGSSTAYPSYTYLYDNKGAIGEQACYTNQLDYILTVTGQINVSSSSNNTAYYIYINSNTDTLVTQTGIQYSWGIVDGLFSVLKCHPDCYKCTGPSNGSCTACWDTKKTVSNGFCVCNVASNFYYIVGSTTNCTTGCPVTALGIYFADNVTGTCVTPPSTKCSAPNYFGNRYQYPNSYGYCITNCPVGTYASTNVYICVTSCGGQSQYAYNGSTASCVNVCPSGWIRDPSTWTCVLVCPSSYWLSLTNVNTDPFCANNCTTGYQYDTQRVCVTSCPVGYYTQTISSHNKCVQNCTNAFGDNSTGACVLSCPFPSFANPVNHLCVDECPSGYLQQVAIVGGNRTCVLQSTMCQLGQYQNPILQICVRLPTQCPVGTYADNTTRKCQYSCLTLGQVGDNTTMMCQSLCTHGYAFWAGGICVASCPASPNLFGFAFANTTYVSGSCVASCAVATTGVNLLFADIQANRTCVATCSASPVATFGDNSTSKCVQQCTVSGKYGDPLNTNRYCVSVCTSSPQTYSFIVTKLCVAQCPSGYYGDNTTSAGVGVCSPSCIAPYYADSITNLCVLTCSWGYFGHSLGIRPCVKQCPNTPVTYFGQNATTNRICVTQCDVGFYGDVNTTLCNSNKTQCTNNTFGDYYKRQCVGATNCTNTTTTKTYSDPFTMGCELACSNSSYFGDYSTTSCVTQCPSTPDLYSQSGICKLVCSGGKYADWQANRTCLTNCSRTPIALFGYNGRCYKASDCPATYYGDNNTITCVSPCNGSSTLPFGDSISKQCVFNCPSDYWGDYDQHLCVSTCNFNTTVDHYADNITGNCQTMCSNGTYGVNSTSKPICQTSCPNGTYAYEPTRKCVANCGSGYFGDPLTWKCYNSSMLCSAGLYGLAFTNNTCVQPSDCVASNGTHLYAQNSTKMCVPQCLTPNYGDSKLWLCIAVCNITSFGENNTRLCLTGCAAYSSFADSQNHLCVSQCTTFSISLNTSTTYSQNNTYKCVSPLLCPNGSTLTNWTMFAENITQSCVYLCPLAGGTVGPSATPVNVSSFADYNNSRRCVAVCPDGFYADDSTLSGVCVQTCPGTYRFRDNSTRSCVSICPNSTFGDSNADMCVNLCPDTYYGQQDANRRCVKPCMSTTWGNPVNRLCVSDPLLCPSNTWADNYTHLCTTQCSASQNYYGINSTKLCDITCPSPSFAFDGPQICIDICPASVDGPGYFGDPTTTPRKCYLACVNTSLYRDVAANRTCVLNCTFTSTYKTYADPTTMSCQVFCSKYPLYLYAQNSTASCVPSCANGYFKNDATQQCVQTCPTLVNPLLFQCVSVCPRYTASNVSLYAAPNNTCVVAASCPNNTYASDDSMSCVSTCPNGTWIYGYFCVSFCPDSTYINANTSKCVAASGCQTNYFADNQTRTCVATCVGTYGDNSTRMCINTCYGTLYGDPFTHKCASSCSGGLSINAATNLCISSCSPGLYLTTNGSANICSSTCSSPYYADNLTGSCVSQCSANPMTFASTANSVRACVSVCPSTMWHDMINRVCVSNCTNSYAYSVNASCVASCPSPNYYILNNTCVTNCSSAGRYSDDITRSCTLGCSTGLYKDSTTYKCVAICPIYPQVYYISTYTGTCVLNCSTIGVSGYFADATTGMCVTQCPTDPSTFADSRSGTCVEVCPTSVNSFADSLSRTCMSPCPSGYFADNRTRSCTNYCGNTLFADSLLNPPSCAANCSVTTYADELTFTCVSNCPSTYYSYTPTGKCIQFCPNGYFGDNSTGHGKCTSTCLTASIPYADSLTHTCVLVCSNSQYAYILNGTTTGGSCLFYCPSGYYSDPTSMTCKLTCPSGLFSQTTNNTCTNSCPLGQFMDSINHQCTGTCPSANLLFGDPFTYQCVTQCNSTGYNFTFADTLSRKCQTTCTGSQYADPATMRCVSVSGCTTGTYADPFYKKCVSVCYNNTYSYNGACIPMCPSTPDLYGSNATRSCVNATSCPTGTFAHLTKRICVTYCDLASAGFADNSSRKCLANCSSPLFADNTTRACVSVCPSVPQLYGDNNTRSCVEYCSSGFGDPSNSLCVGVCANNSYSNNLTFRCVAVCPEGSFADDNTNRCVAICPSSPVTFGDPVSRACVLNCSAKLYADDLNNRKCVSTCSSTLFAQNSTFTCLPTCLTGYANPRTRQCIAVCTAGYYAYNFICYNYSCPSGASPTVYADDISNTCVPTCPNNTYGDITTLKCVKICPISSNLFADTTNKICVEAFNCPGTTYADSSLRTCVTTCSSVPALYGYTVGKLCLASCINGLFASNATRTCGTGCPNGTYADNITYTCELGCQSKYNMFAYNITNTCVYTCPSTYNMYADNQTRKCVYNCPYPTFADSNSRKCVDICPSGWYGDNTTRTCLYNACSTGQFADSLLRLCVASCSVDPIYYGNGAPNINLCVPVCPSGSFGNPLTQQCVYNFNSASTCPTHYYGDSSTMLCVQVCPMKQNTYGDATLKKCVAVGTCSNGYFSDNSTMKCVSICPSYPNYFGNTASKICVFSCPNNTWADNSTRLCNTGCPNGTYAENSTWRCVSRCLIVPFTFADNSTWRCVSVCPNNTYADQVNLQCIPTCTSASTTYAINGTNKCTKVCPNGTYASNFTRMCMSACPNSTYADNSSNTCVFTCPSYPAYYADNTTYTCVFICPSTMWMYEGNRSCVLNCPEAGLFRDSSTHKCVANCPYNSSTYADNLTGNCQTNCTSGFADPVSHQCVAICPDQPMLYAENTSHTCVPVCPGSSFGQNSTRTCVAVCPSNSLSMPATHLCVLYCPSNYFAYIPTQYCVDTCQSPYYGDPSTRSCVTTCPLNQLLFADNSSRKCVLVCPSGSYADARSVSCVGVCPDAVLPYIQTYAADYNNVCVEECSLPYFAYLPTKKCVSICPAPYYSNVTDHKCHICPTQCLSCTGLLTCTACISSFYLQNGACLQTCTLNYYANTTSNKCVTSYDCKPYFGMNSSHMCVAGCQIGQYPNIDVYRCDACPSTCTQCISSSNCSACTSVAVLSNWYCYGFCNKINVTLKYFSLDNITCVAICPAGSYSSVVFCLPCNAACTTCSGSATSCLQCSNGLYLLNTSCVSSCGTGYKPNTNRTCIYCGSTCGAALTFNSNITQINGQTNIFMNFNKDMTINGDLYNTISVIPTGGRLLEDAAQGRLLQSTPQYTIIIIDSTTIQIIFPPGSVYSNYNINILQPQNIRDSFGNLPSSVRASLAVDMTNIYQNGINSANADLSIYFMFLSIVCVVSFMFDIELMKFLQLLFIHYFLVMTLPPSFTKVFLALRYSTLYYLPDMFVAPAAVLRPQVPSNVYSMVGDYSFLRNAGFAFTPLAVIILVWVVLKLLSLPQINRFKDARLWCKTLLDDKFRFAVFLQWLIIIYTNTIFFAFLQMRDYTVYDSFTQASLVIAHLVAVLALIVMILIVYRLVSFMREYPKLSDNLKKATELILQDQEIDQLNSHNIFLFQRKKIDLRNIYYPKVNNQNIFPFKCIYKYSPLALLCYNVTLLRATLLSVIIVFAQGSTVMQMAIAIPLNVLTLLYFIRGRPYSFKFHKYRVKNYIAIFHQVALIIFEFLLLALGIMQSNGSTGNAKESFCYAITYYLIAVTAVSLAYFIFRIAVHVYRKMWLVFIESELFRVNFPQKYAKYQAQKNKGKKLANQIDPQAKQALKALIKGYKKNRSSLRPTDADKDHPNLPMKYKITYFDRDASSSASSRSSLTKSQRKKMLGDIFHEENPMEEKEQMPMFEELVDGSEATQPEFEEYEQEIEIKAKDLAMYVNNAEQLLRMKRNKYEDQ